MKLDMPPSSRFFKATKSRLEGTMARMVRRNVVLQDHKVAYFKPSDIQKLRADGVNSMKRLREFTSLIQS
jgi:hypothetical protein